MAVCRECGGENPVSSRYCVQCGHPLPQTCVICGAELPAGARFCPACGRALTPPPAEGERKLVTVLFSDIVGSTSLGEKVDPERWRSLLDAYFSAMTEVIRGWGGTVEKFIGDAIVAIFGVPTAREDDPERALRAALGMLDRLTALNRDLEASHGLSLEMRIGVNTGEVLASASAGPDDRMVSGDAANVAARLQTEAEPNGILVGERTYLATRGAFSFGEPSRLELKGRSGVVTAYRVVRIIGEPRRGVEGLRARMVGRDAELRLLTSLFDEVIATGRPRLVTIIAPAGVGKSRLVREFAQGLGRQRPDARFLRGRCLAAGQGVTYWALAEILWAACAISLDDSVEVLGDKLRAAAGGVLFAAGAGRQETDRTIFALATSVGIRLPDNPLARASPEAVMDELARAWPRFASALAAAGPTVLLVEDLHWAGDALVEMLERIVTRSSGPLLVVATARPEAVVAHPRLGGGAEEFSTITLRALTEAQSQQLLAALLPRSEIDAEVRADILARAEGNPFFLEEMLQHLIDEGALVLRDDRWFQRVATVGASLPDSLHALLAARIDALPATQKRVLQEAAVVGRVFWPDPLARNLAAGELASSLRELERRGLILVRPTSTLAGQAEYSFKHMLLRDVAYGSVPKIRRARAHAEVATWIEAMAGDRRDEFAELLAYHYQAAAVGDGAELAWPDAVAREPVRAKAFGSLVRAGAVARQRGAVRKAIELHTGALSLAATTDERRHAYEEIGDDHESVLHGEDAVASYRDALMLAAEVEARIRLLTKIGWLMASSPGAFRQSPDGAALEELIFQAQTIAPDEVSRGLVLALRAMAARLWRGSEPFGQGFVEDPVPVHERIEAAGAALEIGRRHGDLDLIRKASEALELLYGITGRYRELSQMMETALDNIDEVPSRIGQADVLRSAATVTMQVEGRFKEGLALAHRSYALSRGSSAHHIMHATHALIFGLYHLGRWQELIPVVQEHVTAFREDPAVVCRFVRDGPVIGAIACSQMGDRARAIELAALVGDPRDDRDNASAAQAMLAIELGDSTSALEIAMPRARLRNMFGPSHAVAAVEALAVLRDWTRLAELLPAVRRQVEGNALLGPICDRAEALMMVDREMLDDGLALMRSALRGFETLSVPFEVARVNECMAEMVGPGTATGHLNAALAGYERVRAVPSADRIRGMLARSSAASPPRQRAGT